MKTKKVKRFKIELIVHMDMTGFEKAKKDGLDIHKYILSEKVTPKEYIMQYFYPMINYDDKLHVLLAWVNDIKFDCIDEYKIEVDDEKEYNW